MAVNLNYGSVPLLSPQQMGVPDISAAMLQGLQIPQSYQNILQTQLANQKSRELMPFVKPTAEAELTKLQQANQWNPQIWQSEIGLRGAQTKEAEALAGLHGSESQVKQMMVDYLKGMNQTQDNQHQIAGNPQNQMMPNQVAGPYGVDIPRPTRDDIMNKALFGIDTFSQRNNIAKEQLMNQYSEYNKEISTAVQESQGAQSLDNAINVFNDAMNRSFYKGATLGGVPSAGWTTAITPTLPFGKGMAPEQEADNAANQMLPAAISTLKNAMGSARFSNLDLMQAQKLKFYRGMDDDTRKLQTAWVNGINTRIKEKPKFYSNLNSKVPKQVADMLWNEYQNNLPLISDNGKNVLKNNLNKWPAFVTPEAIQSIQQTGSYKPSPEVLNAVWMRIQRPNGQMEIVPIKKNKVGEAIKAGATTI